MALGVTGVDTVGMVQLARANTLDQASVRNKVLDMKRGSFHLKFGVQEWAERRRSTPPANGKLKWIIGFTTL
jgi:hypothetical protein